jgi:hypothetical protein
VKEMGHVRPELIITEIVDENGKQATWLKSGEVVITPLSYRMPLIGSVLVISHS